jgi:hypothetical protein
MMHNDNQSIIVRHKEYLGEIKSSQTFSVQNTFPLNPGIAVTFPWLSGIANKFQEYRIKGLVFHYIPSSGAAVSATNAALGTVMLQTSYRSTDALPSTKVELLNEYCSNEVVPSETMAHPVECDPRENPFNVQYVRSGPVPTGDTQLMYDLGQTHVAVSGCQSTGNTIGDLWVTYEVELKKPLVASNATATVLYSYYSSISTRTITTIFSSTATTAIGTIPAVLNNNLITFPKGLVGTFGIWLLLSGNTLALSIPTITVSGCVQADWQPGQPVFSNNSGSSINDWGYAVTITDPTVNATINFNVAGTATSIGSTRVSLFEQS